MKRITQVLPISDPSAINQAKAILEKGGLVVFPTDTLYGLAGDYRNLTAIESIYDAKGRSAAKALPVLISDLAQLAFLVHGDLAIADRLMSAYWPGPLTLVLPKIGGVAEGLTPYPGLAVRMPGHPFALALLTATGPLAVTSANLSDQPNPVDAQGVLDQLDGKIDLLLDGGELRPNPGSTIVDCLSGEPRLVRQGVIPFSDILKKVKY